MSSRVLQSPSYEISDTAEAIELYYAKGWTDGLPVIPPTENLIQFMIEAAGLKPGEEIAYIKHRHVSVTGEKVAINAVLAGCKPEYMPVIVATIKAMADRRWGYHGAATSTGGSAVFMLVNGPIARELKINHGDNLFGPGNRVNATIGRAVRLVMRNVIGTLPGTLDRSTLGHGGKYSFCIAENEEESPWQPFHVERGFQPEESTVTAFAALAPHQFYNQLSSTAEGILSTLCAHMRISAGVGMQPQYLLVIAGEHMHVLAKEGWSKDDIRRFCFEHTQSSRAELKRINVIPGAPNEGDESTMQPLVATPEDFIVIAAGSRVGAFSAFIPGWGSKRITESVTQKIHLL